MISFKNFVTAIQDAIVRASDTMRSKNLSFLDDYFIKENKENVRETLVPKSVIMEYPSLKSDGTIEKLEVAVPLITLAPVSMPQIEKVVLTAHFEMALVDNEVHLHFSDCSATEPLDSSSKKSWGKIEMTFSPQENPEDLRQLIAGYEDILKREVSPPCS